MKAVILGTTRGIRHLDANKSEPIHFADSLTPSDTSKTALDWILQGLSSSNITNVSYVGGYHIEKVLEDYPQLDVHYLQNWEKEGEIGALTPIFGNSSQEKANDPLLVFTPQFLSLGDGIREILNVAGKNPGKLLWFKLKNSEEGAYFIPPQFFEKLTAGIDSRKSRDAHSSKEKLSNFFFKQAFPILEIDFEHLGCDYTKIGAASRLILGTKSKTLERLRPLLKKSIILKQYSFTVAEWKSMPGTILNGCRELADGNNIVVRSSALSEDGWLKSNAGAFKSILNVPVKELSLVVKAIEEVIGSFSDSDSNHQILVQPFLSTSKSSGVVFTRDSRSGAPYYILNLDTQTGKTDTITSGYGTEIEPWYVHKNHISVAPNPIRPILEAVREIEDLVGHDALDIELALRPDGQVVIFQVRPLVLSTKTDGILSKDLSEELEGIDRYLEDILSETSQLAGKRSALGIMPDWNPAEILGESPSLLATSIYKKIITQDVWSRARQNLGYNSVEATPLLHSLCGRPFIDVRASLNSFLPSGLSNDVKERIVDSAIEHLKKNPFLHDKLEFSVIATCAYPGTEEQTAVLKNYFCNDSDVHQWEEGLVKLTNEIIGNHESLIQREMNLVQLCANIAAKLHLELNEAKSLRQLSLILNQSLDKCIQHGTLPFAVLARLGFIAITQLKGLERKNVFSKDEIDLILRNIPTVATDFTHAISGGSVDSKSILSAFGHLRPNSYDIDSPSLKDRPELIGMSGGSIQNGSNSNPSVVRHLFTEREDAINSALRSAGLEFNAKTLCEFIISAIPAREKSKFEFMKLVDIAIICLRKISIKMGFTNNEIRFLSIESILGLSNSTTSPAMLVDLTRRVTFNKKRYEITKAIHLPAIIFDSKSVYCFQQERSSPNFITSKRVSSATAVINSAMTLSPKDIKGKIVIIENADPGYDWLFNHGIAGLITKYGGVASHMAIRAAEFGLPAAIGVGEKLFGDVVQSNTLTLDCENKQITVGLI